MNAMHTSMHTTETAHASTDLRTDLHTDQRVDTLAARDLLTLFLENTLHPHGFEVVAIEVLQGRENVLRLFIDHLKTDPASTQDGSSAGISTGIGIEDCVKVNQILDEPLELSSEVAVVFGGPYELEVSSPGIESPLRKLSDFQRFQNRIARIHTHRALMSSDMASDMASDETTKAYLAKNSKQKNFYGVLRGADSTSDSILFGVMPEDGRKFSSEQLAQVSEPLKNETRLTIPRDLIAKANLEIKFDNNFEGENT